MGWCGAGRASHGASLCFFVKLQPQFPFLSALVVWISLLPLTSSLSASRVTCSHPAGVSAETPDPLPKLHAASEGKLLHPGAGGGFLVQLLW